MAVHHRGLSLSSLGHGILVGVIIENTLSVVMSSQDDERRPRCSFHVGVCEFSERKHYCPGVMVSVIYIYALILYPPPTGLQNTMRYSETENLSCGQNVSLKVYWSHGNKNGRFKINIEIHLISQQSKQEQGRIQDFGRGGGGPGNC